MRKDSHLATMESDVATMESHLATMQRSGIVHAKYVSDPEDLSLDEFELEEEEQMLAR